MLEQERSRNKRAGLVGLLDMAMMPVYGLLQAISISAGGSSGIGT